jgi:uncharacterized protein (TIGR03435 family)
MKGIATSARLSCLSLTLAFGLATLAPAQNGPPHPPARPAAQAAAPYQLQLEPTKMQDGSVSIAIEGDSWIARGFDLRSLFAQIYDFDPRRVDFTDHNLADTRYDITLTTPTEMDEDALQRLVVGALEKKLGMSIVPESRALDVYVLTAPGGPSAAMHPHTAPPAGETTLAPLDAGDGTEQFTFEARHCTGKASSKGITASGGTMREFGRQLEQDLDRLLIDETHLTAGYDFTVAGYANQEALFKVLHDQLGLVVTPARRNVDVLVVRAAGGIQAGL